MSKPCFREETVYLRENVSKPVFPVEIAKPRTKTYKNSLKPMKTQVFNFSVRRCGGDVAEMWRRCGEDVAEMWRRCGGDVAEGPFWGPNGLRIIKNRNGWFHWNPYVLEGFFWFLWFLPEKTVLTPFLHHMMFLLFFVCFRWVSLVPLGLSGFGGFRLHSVHIAHVPSQRLLASCPISFGATVQTMRVRDSCRLRRLSCTSCPCWGKQVWD